MIIPRLPHMDGPAKKKKSGSDCDGKASPCHLVRPAPKIYDNDNRNDNNIIVIIILQNYNAICLWKNILNWQDIFLFPTPPSAFCPFLQPRSVQVSPSSGFCWFVFFLFSVPWKCAAIKVWAFETLGANPNLFLMWNKKLLTRSGEKNQQFVIIIHLSPAVVIHS